MTDSKDAAAGTTVRLTAADGHRLDAYLATPAAAPRGGVVVIQEIFGVNPHIRDVCDRYAAEGYLAIAPAMFDRVERGVELAYDPDNLKRAQGLRRQLTDWNQALADAEAAADHLRRAGAGKVAIVGYCFGGEVAWIAAARGRFDAAVAYYGHAIVHLLDETPKVPVIMHFGTTDHLIPLADVEAIRAARPDVPVYVYEGAGHGFNCDRRPSYHAASAELALERNRALLHEHVG